MWVTLTEDTEKKQGIEHICLSPVSSYLYPRYEKLRTKYHALTPTTNDEALAKLELLQRIINLHERFDSPGLFGFDVYRLGNATLDQLGTLTEFDFLNADRFPPVEQIDEDEYAPPWSTNDQFLDWSADLLYSFSSFSEVENIFRAFSRSEVAHLMKRLKSLSKTKQERETEKSKEFYHKKYLKSEQGKALMDDIFAPIENQQKQKNANKPRTAPQKTATKNPSSIPAKNQRSRDKRKNSARRNT